MSENEWDQLAAIASARKLKKIYWRIPSLANVSCIIEKNFADACAKRGINTTSCAVEEDADAIVIDEPETEYLRHDKLKNITIIEISRFFKSVQFEKMESISCVFDIETVNRSDSNSKISDRVVTLYMNTCIGTSVIDRVYFTTVMPNFEKWSKMKSEKFNRFSQSYKKYITGQYFAEEDGDVVNLIFCKGGEAQLVRSFVNVLNAIRPHNTVTFNGETFDWPFLIRSGFRYDINLAQSLSILRENVAEFVGTDRISKSEWRLKRNPAGFINKSVLNLDYDSLFPFIHLDLIKYNRNKGSLNEICQTRLGIEKIDLDYHEIPKALYGKEERLAIYNKRDVDITTRLYVDQYFFNNKYYAYLEDICGIPRDLSANEKRSTPTSYMKYTTNNRFRIVEPATCSPKRIHVNLIFKELIDYFFVHKQRLKLEELEYPESKQLLSDYHNGALKTNALWKKFPEIHNDNVGMETINEIYLVQTVFDDCANMYNTVNLLKLLSYLSNSRKNLFVKPFKNIIKKFFGFFEFTEKKVEDRQRRMREECEKLINLMYYLVSTYKHFSPFQDAALLWIDYAEYYKTYNQHNVIKEFYNRFLTKPETGRITEELHVAVTESQKRYEPRSFTHDSARELLSQISEKDISLKMLAFDGAFIEEPTVGTNLKFPVVCVDIASQYPSCILHLNLGPQTEISLDYVLQNKLSSDDFKSVNKRRTDDDVSYTKYLELGMSDYVRDNYIFFLSKNHTISVLAKEYKKQIDARLTVKKLIKTAETPEKKQRLTEKSDALKVDINSKYGNLGNVYRTFNCMPAVTAKGRQTIIITKKKLKQLFGENLQNRYGDTDSYFFSLNKCCSEILNMSLDEAYVYFNGTQEPGSIVSKEYIKSLYSKIHEFGSDKSEEFLASFVIHTFFEKCVIPILNAVIPEEINLELEKVMIPFIICSKKKYAAFKPLDGETLTKGMSIAQRTSLKATKQLLDFFLDSIKNKSSNFDLITLYHYIGENFLVPIKNGTIDLSLICKSVSHNITKTLKPKEQNMINRLKEEGKKFFFDTIKEVVVCVEPVKPDKDWSVVTTKQFENGNYKLNKEKIMMEIMPELMTILSVSYSAKQCVPFEALQLGYYDPNLKSILDDNAGDEKYKCPPSKIPTANKRKRYDDGADNLFDILYSENASRFKRKKLPGWIKTKKNN